MGMFDINGFGIKPIKTSSFALQPIKKKDFTMHQTKVGDRTLTPAQKRKLKEDAGFRCSECNKKLESRDLEIHHKKAIHKHKSASGFDLPVYSMGKKIKPTYDRKSNLQVICYKCHDKTKKKKNKKTTNNPYALNFKIGGF